MNPARQFRIENSQLLLERAWKVIPSATQTFSKGSNQWVRGVSPSYLVKGDGAWVWDADGNKYLDYLMALGPIILGYGNQSVNQAIYDQIKNGTVFSQMHPLEVELAEKLVEIIPCAEMVRFGKNGSDATTASIRLARAITGREHIACCGYHGWHDWYIGSTTRSAGVPKAVRNLTHTFAYNEIDSLKSLFKDFPQKFAAVIMEAISVDEPDPGFLEEVKDITHENGAILIFDEIVNGLRLALGGAQELIGVSPDIATFGKAMANGMPLSAVVGKREYMEVFDEIFFSGTFGGETASLAAGLATVNEIEKKGVINHLWKFGGKLKSGINNLIEQFSLSEAIQLVGYDPYSIMTFPHDDEKESRTRRSYFMQECHKRGLLYFGIHMPTASHGDLELEFTLKVLSEVMPMFASGYQANDFSKRLEGEIIEPIFRKR